MKRLILAAALSFMISSPTSMVSAQVADTALGNLRPVRDNVGYCWDSIQMKRLINYLKHRHHLPGSLRPYLHTTIICTQQEFTIRYTECFGQRRSSSLELRTATSARKLATRTTSLYSTASNSGAALDKTSQSRLSVNS